MGGAEASLGCRFLDKILINNFLEENQMVDYGLKDKVAVITGADNPWGIGAKRLI